MTLDELVSGIRVILLDFDGPVCDVFSGFPAPRVAQEMRDTFGPGGFEFDGEGDGGRDYSDPLNVLRWVAEREPDRVSEMDAFLTSLEVRAVQSARPTDHSVDVLRSAKQSQRPVVIVSNNSSSAIDAYLARWEIDRYISLVVGRPFADPERMKPDTFGINQALEYVGVPVDCAAFVGDTVSDIQAARSAGVHSISYAKHADRLTKLRAAGSDLVIETMSELADSLRRV